MTEKIPGLELDPDLMQRFADLALRKAKNPELGSRSHIVGQRVAEIRQDKGLSRAQLAVLSGVGDFRIEMLERGLLADHELPVHHVEALAEALHVEAGRLLNSPVADEQVEPGTDWMAVLRQWGIGMLKAVKDGWEWTPRPASGLVPVSRGRERPFPGPQVDLVEPSLDRVRIRAGRAFAGGVAVLLQQRSDRSGYDPIVEATLDEEGTGEIALPHAGLPLHIALLPSRQQE
jgi:transcriptional regulator with XRE-family HTH domain